MPPKTTKPAFTWEAFENGKIAVKCKKKPLAKLFLEWCDERGYKWNNGGKATKAECIRHATFPIRFVHNFNEVNDLSFSDWPLANFPEINLTDILTIRESEPNPEPPKFSWEEFKTETIAVNCKTEEEAKRFGKMCDKLKLSCLISEKDNGSTTFMYEPITDETKQSPRGFYVYDIIDSTEIPDLKYRPFRELKADLILRTVRNKICLIVDFIARYRPENKTVEINGMRVNASELFEYYEFLDPKTGETSPCGEVDCE